jgi:hypothetical protein
MDCSVVDSPALPAGWISKAYIGLSASTGALADNHDIISLETFSEFDVLETYEEESRNRREFDRGEGMAPEERLAR